MASRAFAALLDELRRHPPAADASFDELRAGTALVAGMGPLPPDVHWQTTRIGRSPAEWMTTLSADGEGALLYLHGGAFVTGSPAVYREITSRLSRFAGVRVLVPECRLAPEHPFPAALEDAFAAYRWLLRNGFDAGRIGIAGDSSGAGLALATLVSIRDAGDPLPAAGAFFSPWIDLEGTGDSFESRAHIDPVLHPALLRRCAEAYLGGCDPRVPLASPLYAKLDGLPPLLVQVGTAEILHDDAVRLVSRARDAGVDATLERWDDMIHVWQLFAAILPEARDALTRAAQFVRERFR